MAVKLQLLTQRFSYLWHDASHNPTTALSLTSHAVLPVYPLRLPILSNAEVPHLSQGLGAVANIALARFHR